MGVRGALGHSDLAVFEGGLEAMIQLSNVVGPQLNPHLNKLLVPVSISCFITSHIARNLSKFKRGQKA